MAIVSAPCTASASRLAPLSMSRKQLGSGRKSRILGSRWRARSSRATPRASNSSSTSASMPSPGSASRRQRHGCPLTDRSMLSTTPIGAKPMSRGFSGLEAAVLQVVIFCGYAPDRAGAGPHDDALGGYAALAAVHSFQQRPVRDAGRGEDAVALGHVAEMIDAPEVLDAPAVGAGDLVVVAEDELALHLPADAAQRRRCEN